MLKVANATSSDSMSLSHSVALEQPSTPPPGRTDGWCTACLPDWVIPKLQPPTKPCLRVQWLLTSPPISRSTRQLSQVASPLSDAEQNADDFLSCSRITTRKTDVKRAVSQRTYHFGYYCPVHADHQMSK